MNILLIDTKNTCKSIKIESNLKKSSTFDFFKIKSVLRDVINKRIFNKIDSGAGIIGFKMDPYGSSISVYKRKYKKLSGIVPVILDKIKKEGCI